MKTYELVLLTISTLSTIAIPIVITMISYRDSKQKENRDIEADRKEKLQHYYQNVIIPNIKELENIIQIRQERRILICEKLVLNTSQQYKDALSIEHEEYSRIEYTKMISILGKIIKAIGNIQLEIKNFQLVYIKVLKYLEYISEIAMSIDIEYFFDKTVNHDITMLIVVITGQVSMLLQVIESSIIYEIYDSKLESSLLKDIDTLMQEFLINIYNYTGLEFSMLKEHS